MHSHQLTSALCALAATTAALGLDFSDTPHTAKPLPLVIWHGLGDAWNSEGMESVAKLAEKINPGTFVYRIGLAEDGSTDRRSSFFGNVNDQVDDACKQLASVKELAEAPAINAIGFSQGGPFMRAYVQRCNNPPVHNLVTFGSPHNGIATYAACDDGDWLCNGATMLLQGNTWANWVQTGLVPAQYFRDPEDLDSYLESSNFLADLNNERKLKNVTYSKNLAKLNKFVMYAFAEEDKIHPPESVWFSEVNGTTGNVTRLQDRALYKEDWIGLKVLDEKRKLEFLTIPGAHMRLSKEVLSEAFAVYFGPVSPLSYDGLKDALLDGISGAQKALHL